MRELREITKCRVCNSTDLVKYLDLGSLPLSNSLSKYYLEFKSEYPLEVYLCNECHLSQLGLVVNPNILFHDYVYESSVSETFKKHCKRMANDLKIEFGRSEDALVMDIAANDGCLLEQFRSVGFNRVLAVEPSKNLAWKCIDKSIPVIPEFWSEKLANEHRSNYSCGAQFITATNVLAHVDDIYDFLAGVKWFLEPDGVFVCEVPYMGNLLLDNEFDTIYHEHLSYFLLKPLVLAFEKAGLPIFRIEHFDIHGGSLRVYASKGFHEVEDSVIDLLEDEKLNGMYEISTYRTLRENTNSIKVVLNDKLRSVVAEGKTVYGYAASAKGINLLNYCDIDQTLVKFVVDDTPSKQGKFIPCANIEIVDFSLFETRKPDYILILAWNFKDELMDKTKHLGCKYIIPIPEVEVI